MSSVKKLIPIGFWAEAFGYYPKFTELGMVNSSGRSFPCCCQQFYLVHQFHVLFYSKTYMTEC